MPPVSAFNSVGEYRSRAYSGGVGSIPAGRICSRHGEPVPESSKLIAVSGYRDKNSSGHTS